MPRHVVCHSRAVITHPLHRRHLDTAAFYENEEDVGRAVRDSGIPRDEIFITSKVWPGEDGEWLTDGQKAVLDTVETTVKLLGTHTDLYLIHTPFNPTQRINYYLGLEVKCVHRTCGACGASEVRAAYETHTTFGMARGRRRRKRASPPRSASPTSAWRTSKSSSRPTGRP
jgi:hypothetical protein